MKCQKCQKDATFHITELSGGKPVELHLCEDHARQYLSESEEGAPAGDLASMLAQQLGVSGAAEELARLEQKTCPACGITFAEFRKQGRLGCAHDYEFFGEEIEPLLLNVHGDTQHVGKVPKGRGGDSGRQTELLRLRREMKEAIAGENYELASRLRDDIRRVEDSN